MPTTLLLITTGALLIVAAALISGRAIARNLRPQVTRDGQPRLYWVQVCALGVITLGLLMVAVHVTPFATRP